MEKVNCTGEIHYGRGRVGAFSMDSLNLKGNASGTTSSSSGELRK